MNTSLSRNFASVLLAGALAFFIFGAIGVWAANYSIVFNPLADGNLSVTLGSPHGGSDYRWVTSKFIQPRTVGTSPHQGTDLRSAYGEAVYAPWNGWVVLANQTDFEMRLDINRDGLKNDNAYFRYDHLSSIRYATGSFVTQGTWVASSGNENGGTIAHLHFGVRKDTNGDGVSDVWVHNERYYRAIAAWDYGRLLDFISNSTWSTGDVAAAYCYAADENSQNENVVQGDVVIFHRLAGTSTWTGTVATKSGNQFYVDLTGRYSPGASVNWMVRCNRTSIKSSGVPYWSFEPPKFAQPGYDPNATAYTYEAWVSTMN